MAERRMFAKSIIDSDAFLDMPLSAQSLYFHLSMRADDEGFINNHKKIQRMIGASDDDMKVLLAKNFIISFESGVIVIKHWKIHNYIRADRLIKTNYEEERSLLDVKDNGAYTLIDGLLEIDALSATDKRKLAYKESSLPYSFEYKIKRFFEGEICPVCGRTMTSAYKTTLPTIQHNLPISKGGKHEIDNISVICETCNTSIKAKETDSLNNADVIKAWDCIVTAEKNNVSWFWTPSILKNPSVSQLSDKCQSNVSIGKDSIGKDSIGKDNIKKRFTKPTLDEVRAYCQERNNKVDPESFIDFYESKGWKIGKDTMKDWKAAVRTWERRDKGAVKETVKKMGGNTRTYSSEDFAALERDALNF